MYACLSYYSNYYVDSCLGKYIVSLIVLCALLPMLKVSSSLCDPFSLY